MSIFDRIFEDKGEHPLTISLEPDKQEYFIDALGNSQCSTMRGAFDLAVALVGAVNKAYQNAYKISHVIPERLIYWRALAARLYFLEKTGGLDCDLSILIKLLCSDYQEQLEFLSCYPELSPWVESERYLYHEGKSEECFKIRNSLAQGFAQFADPSVRSLFSTSFKNDKTGYDITQMDNWPKRRYFKFVECTQYSDFLEVFLDVMSDWYCDRGHSLRVYHFEPCWSIEPKDLSFFSKQESEHLTVTVKAPAQENKPAEKQQTAIRNDEACRKILAQLKNGDIRTVNSAGIIYQHCFDSYAFRIAMGTPRMLSRRVRLLKQDSEGEDNV